jgi:hypothetical protein
VIFDAPQRIIFQRTDDSFITFGVAIHEPSGTMALTKGSSRTWSSAFTYQRPDAERLILDGTMDGHRIHVELQRLGLDTFRLLNSRFRWIRPPDSEAG